MLFLVLFPIITGCGLAAQSAVNSRLRYYVESPHFATLLTFLTGGIFLILAMVVTHDSFVIPSQVVSGEPWWVWSGGILGLIGVTMLILLFPILGSVQTTILTIGGQILMGVLVDQLGWFNAAIKPLNTWKIVGIAILIAGVVWSNLAQGQTTRTQAAGKHRFLWQLAAVLTGMVIATQATVNGYLGSVLGSSLYAVVISFMLSLVILTLILLIVRAPWHNLQTLPQGVKEQPWIIAGGLLGAIYTFSVAWLIPLLGTAKVVIFGLFGQVAFSIVIDHFGLFEAEKQPVTTGKLCGLAVAFVGVLLVSLH